MASTSDRGFTDDRDIHRRAAWILGVISRSSATIQRQARQKQLLVRSVTWIT